MRTDAAATASASSRPADPDPLANDFQSHPGWSSNFTDDGDNPGDWSWDPFWQGHWHDADDSWEPWPSNRQLERETRGFNRRRAGKNQHFWKAVYKNPFRG